MGNHYVKGDLSISKVKSVKSLEIGLFCLMFGKADAKFCHFLLTEATVIRKISWLTDMRRLCVTFHFGTKQTIEFLEFWPLPLEE